jgi:PiT family inorganic phosphate transporter
LHDALPYVVGLIVVALAFDFLNGLHDAANSIATIVSTRVLPPQYAVFWAASFNFILLVVGFHVRCLQNVIKKRNWGRWQVDATIL